MNKFLLVILIFIIPLGIAAQRKNKKSNPEDLFFEPVKASIEEGVFDIETPLHITLKYDITSFIKTKHKGEYIKAELQAHYKEETVTKKIKLKARGNFRRNHCFFPPIHLNFKNDPAKKKGFEEINKIKLVTHCSISKKNDSYILKEYLVYKLYNVISEKSFRVRLLDIEYIDTGKKERNYRQKGFIIEPLELLVKRIKYTTGVNEALIKGERVKPKEADILALFQYMIGNTDWRIKGGHNVKYIKSLTEITNLVSPVPYDFDFSGFVNTYYAHPQEWTDLINVKDREYLGYIRPEADYLAAIEYFQQKEEKIYETIQNFTYLSEKERSQLIKYVEVFFNMANRPDRFINKLSNQSRSLQF